MRPARMASTRGALPSWILAVLMPCGWLSCARDVVHVQESGPAPASSGAVPPAAQPSAAASSPSVLARMTDPNTPGLGLERWASGEQSTYSKVELHFPKCLRDFGCPFARVEIPGCPPGIEALTVSEALDLANRGLASGAVFVRGVLVPWTTMTDLGCGAGACCNRASGRFVLTDDVTEMNAESTIFISRGRQHAFTCVGDDSTVCCDFPSANVIAFGRVRGQDLDDPRVCQP